MWRGVQKKRQDQWQIEKLDDPEEGQEASSMKFNRLARQRLVHP